MAQTAREVVTKCLKFEYPDRIPRDIWMLPWAEINHPETVKLLRQRFPSDFSGTDYRYPPSGKVKGDPYKKGKYVDEWGCVFFNLQDGIMGEVDNPIICDISQWKSAKPPYEQLPSGLELQKAITVINRSCEKTEKFVIANVCPRPWERYQFLRGTENAMVDVMMPEKGGSELLRVIHEFYLKELEFWTKTNVDAIVFMDDWGSQNQLLIPPRIWRELFKSLYRDYCDLAHSNEKFAFMHSDGYIAEILADLIEVGVDALNSQLFCMDIEQISKIGKGKITFWGEIDRQHVLPDKNPQMGRDAVRKVATHLYDPSGGIIAQLEFGPGANPRTTVAALEEWERIDRTFHSITR